MNYRKILGDNLRVLRVEKNMTQEGANHTRNSSNVTATQLPDLVLISDSALISVNIFKNL
ncbi:MAG: hypothetical protein RR313_06670 [Anaerovoracaceae bacterium]